MPVTRSASRSVSKNGAEVQAASKESSSKTTKRKLPAKTSSGQQNGKKARTTVETPPVVKVPVPVVGPISENEPYEDDLVPAVLGFSFEEAKTHLINVDGRFEDLFKKVKCGPYERLETVHPFQALTESILGQQVSWMAAKAIRHRFIRLYNPSLPEKASDVDNSTEYLFPTPRQVATTDVAILKTAGLSMRKAEYVQDLASRFADGRLSTHKLLNASDEELAEMLIAVRGIGPWTVNMFAIFSLRRPDILPVGDLGVQRGVLRWFLSLHSSSYNVTISAKKLAGAEENDDEDMLPTFDQGEPKISEQQAPDTAPDTSSVPPGDVPATPVPGGSRESLPSMPPPFTPSINKTLNDVTKAGPQPLPEGLTASTLKSRLEGKKKIKGALLTPKEMEDLTESWKPYRSLAVYYMWSLADDDAS